MERLQCNGKQKEEVDSGEWGYLLATMEIGGMDYEQFFKRSKGIC